MNNVIWKYKIEPETILEIPENSKILSVCEQNHEVYLWALVDKNNKVTKRKFISIPTGQHFSSENLEFVNTVFIDSLVFHVFEDLNFNNNK